MAPARKRRRTTKRRIAPMRKRKRVGTRVPRILITPASKIVKLRFTETFDIDAMAGFTASHNFRANGLSDPDQTNLGDKHQCPGFDSWGRFYAKYTVLSSRCRLEVLPNTSEVSNQVAMFLLRSSPVAQSGLGIDKMVDLRSNPRTRSMTAVPRGGGPRNGLMAITNWHSLKRDFGHGPQVVNEGDINGRNNQINDSTDPVEEWFFQVVCGNPWSLTDPGNFHCTIVIDYVVKFHERTNEIFDNIEDP